MASFRPDQTVSSVVAKVPGTARVFERFGIDFCCGGKIPLAQACAEQGVAPEALLDALEQAATAPAADARDWTQVGATELVRHILEVHHAYVKRERPRLSTLMDKVERVHGGAHPDTIPVMARLWRQLSGEIDLHLRKEEEILFPALLALDAGRTPSLHCGVEGPVRMMEVEHEEHGRILARLRSLSNGYVPPEDACGSWRALWAGLDEFERDLHVHVHLENHVLFPRARELAERTASAGYPHFG